MEQNRSAFQKGLKDGIPIALGYITVSFTFGIQAKKAGLSLFESAVMSATNLTSAGQFAGTTMIMGAATLLEVALAQLIINSRYFLMSFALSQKIDSRTPLLYRLIMGYGVTDEIFGVSISAKGKLNPFYTYGLIAAAAPAWTLGTLLGAFSGNILPGRLINALSIALYAMLIAVIVPPAKGNRILSGLILISMVSSLLFSILPVLRDISSGGRIILLTIAIAGTAAFLFPVKGYEK